VIQLGSKERTDGLVSEKEILNISRMPTSVLVMEHIHINVQEIGFLPSTSKGRSSIVRLDQVGSLLSDTIERAAQMRADLQ